MEYGEDYWSEYARGNEARYNHEFAVFVRDLVASLRCQSVLEVGCGTGIDLRLLGDDMRIYGADLNGPALEAAREGMPRGDFRRCDIRKLPFEDSSVDFVFTHKLLNYLDDDTLDAGISEMHRVARRYVMSCEVYGADGEVINGAYRRRDISRRWLGRNVRIVSDVEMHPEIDPDRARFLLVGVI